MSPVVSYNYCDGVGFSPVVSYYYQYIVDSVGDGIPDWWRAQYFGGDGTTTNHLSCASCDPDGDGMPNLQEYLTGTNPTNSASAFRVVSIAQEGDDIRVTWTTGGGTTNVLQAAASDEGGGYTNTFVDLSDLIIIPGGGDTTTSSLDPVESPTHPLVSTAFASYRDRRVC